MIPAIFYKIISILLALLTSVGSVNNSHINCVVIHKTPNESRVFRINDSDKDIGDYQHIEDAFLHSIRSAGICCCDIYDSSELSDLVLENRNGKIIIERCVGLVTDDTQGNEHGIILNAPDPAFNYIGYKDCASENDLREGTVVVSYMIYNPDNNFTDDIIERYDYVVCREYED